jgi:hypothetical protein
MENPNSLPEALCRCASLSDEALVSKLTALAGEERRAQNALIAHLMEFDARKLFSEEGFPSLYAYCTEGLGYSGGEAAWRMHTARAARRFPEVLRLLEKGETHMGAVVQLGPLMTQENHVELLRQARGKNRRELDFMVAGLLTPPAASTDAPKGSAAPTQPPPPGLRDRIDPLSADWVRLSFIAGAGFLSLLDRGRDVLRHKHPSGRMEEVLSEGLEHLLDKKDPGRKAASPPPAECSGPDHRRRAPQWVKDEVWKRDGGRCTFVSGEGRRCAETGGLEYDHIVPWALGGPSNDPRNIRLLCRAHNQSRARREFGEGA